MPFDSISPADSATVIVGNSLSAIGIVPVAREVAEAHKEKMLKWFSGLSRDNADLVRARSARWKLVGFQTATMLANIPSDIPHLEISPPPADIQDIAGRVEREIEGAEFSVEYFNKDPILNVTYRDARGAPHHECLGVWDGANTIAIATVRDQARVVHPTMRTAFRRFFG